MTTKSRVLTVRLSEPAERRLRARARALGVTPSELVRALLDAELGDAPGGTLLSRTRRFVGAVRDERAPAGRDLRAPLEAWEPDRR